MNHNFFCFCVRPVVPQATIDELLDFILALQIERAEESANHPAEVQVASHF